MTNYNLLSKKGLEDLRAGLIKATQEDEGIKFEVASLVATNVKYISDDIKPSDRVIFYDVSGGMEAYHLKSQFLSNGKLNIDYTTLSFATHFNKETNGSNGGPITETDPFSIKKVDLTGSKLLTSTPTTATDGVVVESVITKVALEAQLVAPYVNGSSLDARLTTLENRSTLTALGNTPAGGTTFATSVLIPNQPATAKDGDYLSVQANNQWYTVNATNVKLSIGDRLIWNAGDGGYIITKGGENQTALEVPAFPIIADTTHYPIPSTNVASQIDNISVALKTLSSTTTTTTNTLILDPNNNLISTVNGVATTPLDLLTNLADNGISKGTDNKLELGGLLHKPTAINTTATNTFALTGLQAGLITDENIVIDPTTGVFKKVASKEYNEHLFGYEIGAGELGVNKQTASFVTTPKTITEITGVLVDGISTACTITIEDLVGVVYGTIVFATTATIGTAIVGTVNIATIPNNTVLVLKNSISNLTAYLIIALTTK